MRQLAFSFPQAQFVYFGDSARLPYGNRSRQEISTFVQEIVGFFAESRLDALVVACNTSFALARDVVLNCAAGSGFEVFDLIQPLARYVAASNLKRIGVLATSATARSGVFAKGLEALNFDGKIMEIGCPRLVPLIESGRLGEAEIEAALNHSLPDYLQKMAGAQAIILGCTHFSFLQARVEALIQGPLRASFPGPVLVIDPAPILAQEMLARSTHKLAPDMVHAPIEIFTTGDPVTFTATAKLCLGEEFASRLSSVRQISVSALVESVRQRQANLVTRSGSYPPVLLKPAMAPAGLIG